MFSRVSKLLGSTRSKKTRKNRTFKPMVDHLERRNLLATLFVDDDGATFSGALPSIQTAVNLAAPGDTIRVAAGTYNESVQVDKRLTIIGNGASSSQSQNDNVASIVDPPVGALQGFNLLANDIAIQGFTVGDLDGDATVFPNTAVGIQTSADASGYRIQNNVLEENTFGIYLHSNGVRPSFVLNNTIRDNNQPTAASGNGIYADVQLSNTLIVGNRFSDNVNAAMIFVSPVGNTAINYSRLTITGNTSTGDGAGIILTNAVDSQITGNVIRDSDGSAIFLGGNNSNVNIVGNVLTNGGFTGVNLVTDAYGNAPAPNSDILIASNVIFNFGDSGIRLREGTTDVTVRSNVVRGSQGTDPLGNGISLEGAVNNRIQSNVLFYNNRNGIFADIASSNNTLRSNVAVLNGELDFRDDSVGAGSDGTANFWTRNVGIRANPPGLIG